MRTAVRVTEPVYIPDVSGEVRETIWVEVDAEKDEKGEIYLGGAALRELDRVKARHIGVLLPSEIKEMRERLHLTQQQICEMLGIGDKTYSRWETGRDRPSQSMNKLLVALYDGRMTIEDLRPIQPDPTFLWTQDFPHIYSEGCSSMQPLVIDMPSQGEKHHESGTVPVAA